jgi:uncharacterized protein YkwD
LLSFAVAPAALAESDAEAAASQLVMWGIYQGDERNNLNLDKGMTRAELAAFIARLDFFCSGASSSDDLGEWETWLKNRFTASENRAGPFTDLPAWALPYVEYCYLNDLMQGVSAERFDPQTQVSPKMACAVLLRFGLNGKGGSFDWDYDSSIETVGYMGWLPDSGMDGAVITRGNMAILTAHGFSYRALTIDCSTPPTMSLEEMRDEVLRLVNIERTKEGVPELAALPELTESAQLKAQDLLDNNYFAHESPTYGSEHEMIKSFVPGATYTGENIALGQSTPGIVVNHWMNSDGHRENILNENFTHIGVGAIHGEGGGIRWVQQFLLNPEFDR